MRQGRNQKMQQGAQPADATSRRNGTIRGPQAPEGHGTAARLRSNDYDPTSTIQRYETNRRPRRRARAPRGVAVRSTRGSIRTARSVSGSPEWTGHRTRMPRTSARAQRPRAGDTERAMAGCAASCDKEGTPDSRSLDRSVRWVRPAPTVETIRPRWRGFRISGALTDEAKRACGHARGSSTGPSTGTSFPARTASSGEIFRIFRAPLPAVHHSGCETVCTAPVRQSGFRIPASPQQSFPGSPPDAR